MLDAFGNPAGTRPATFGPTPTGGDAELEVGEAGEVGGMGTGSEEDGIVDGLGLSVAASADGERVEEVRVGKAEEEDVAESACRAGVSAPQLLVA